MLSKFNTFLDVYATINVDCGRVVGGSSNILGQAGVVAGIMQLNSLDMQTAILPHCQILVGHHLNRVYMK